VNKFSCSHNTAHKHEEHSLQVRDALSSVDEDEHIRGIVHEAHRSKTLRDFNQTSWPATNNAAFFTAPPREPQTLHFVVYEPKVLCRVCVT